MGPDREISSEKLKECADTASREAIKRAQKNGIAYTAQQGRKIILHRADGSKKVVGVLPKAFVKPAVRRYRVA